MRLVHLAQYKGFGSRNENAKAFALIDVAAVIVTVCIAGSLLLPTMVRAKEKAAQLDCKSNLRQIGLALQTYSDAHDGSLPGPLFLEAQASYNHASRHELIGFIAENLGLPKPSTSTITAPMLLCPARQRLPAEEHSPACQTSYLLNDDVELEKGSRVAPFGKPSDVSAPPLTLPQLNQYGSPATMFAVSDADKGNVNPSASCWRELPYTPIHTKKRNQLMFDWHVESKPW